MGDELTKAVKKGGIGECFRILMPLTLASAANAVNQFMDRIFLSHYSDAALEGSFPGGMLGWLFITLITCSLSYSGVFVSQCHGAHDESGERRSLAQGIWLSLASFPPFLLLVPIGNWIFGLFGHRPEVLEVERVYYSIMMFGAITNAVIGVFGGYWAGIGRVRFAAAAVLIGNLLNIVFDAWFILRLGYGVAGAGWASVLAQFVSCLIFVLPFVFGFVKFRRDLWGFDGKLAARILRFGIPNGLHVAMDCFSFTLFVLLTAQLDALSLAVSNVVFSISHLSFAPLSGMANGASVVVGNYQGAGDFASARRAGWNCVIIAWIYFLLFAVFIFFFGEAMLGLFYDVKMSFDRREFISLGMTLMWILVSWSIFDATEIVLSGALKGAGDTRFVMGTYMVVGFILWIPVFSVVMKYSPSIVNMWLTVPGYCGIIAVVILGRWIGGRWQRVRLLEGIHSV